MLQILRLKLIDNKSLFKGILKILFGHSVKIDAAVIGKV